MKIYVGYDSPSIICYLEPLAEDLFTTRFTDCHFYETVFPSLGGDKNIKILEEQRELSWTTTLFSHLDSRTAQSETEVWCILDLQTVYQSMLDAFIDLTRVTRSHILAANVPAKIDVLNVWLAFFLEGWDATTADSYTLAAS